MVVIREQVEGGLNALAARNLSDLLELKPDSEEALYLLGACEQARGHPDLAARAWGKVPPDSSFAGKAIVGRVQILMELGRLAEAEDVVKRAMKDPRADRSSLSLSLGPVYLPQVRLEETRRLIEERWDDLNRAGDGASESAIEMIRAHVDLRLTPGDIDATRAALDRAGQLAPDDDRVWLGKANVAIRDGEYGKAKPLLDACADRRPDDTAVCLARLELAMRTDQIGDVKKAMEHLPADATRPVVAHKVGAWFAQKRGDLEEERWELERVVAEDRADFVATGRLADLEAKRGKVDRAIELRESKRQVEMNLARYRQLHARRQPFRDAAEMARLAEQLGQRFEAEAWLTVAVAANPDRADLRRDLARLKQHSDSAAGP
jgi:tetratricopeptide (TPR) repeat protein